MNRPIAFFILLFLILIPSAGYSENATGNVNFALGFLNCSDDFSRVLAMDNRMETGVVCDVKSHAWPVSIAFEYLFSYADSRSSKNVGNKPENRDVDVFASEMYIGAKKLFKPVFFCMAPFVSGGIYTINMYVDRARDDEYNLGVGAWAGAGVYYIVSKNLSVGFQWKWSKAELDVVDRRLDAGGNHFYLMVGHPF